MNQKEKLASIQPSAFSEKSERDYFLAVGY
jgi:hypothetical protein